ncbi:MAG: permease [Bacteriovoracaceae bacterium]|nr:permease [Bacteriovoracaceae bacterium]
MFSLFTKLADIIVYSGLGLDPKSKIGPAVHFFIEDVTKIYFLLILMIYAIAVLRASLNVERVRVYLSGKRRIFGYLLGSSFGAVTPFCSCSSIPLFLGFTQARIPVGITMAFLITSPIINEVAVVLLGSLLGIKFMFIYIAVGIGAGVIGGAFLDFIKAERYLTDIAATIPKTDCNNSGELQLEKLTMRERHLFAKSELKSIFSRVWKWVLIGVGLGAALHGFVPESFITDNLGTGHFWTVPVAVLLGIPLYSNASGIIPVAESLLSKGLPVGTTLAFMMSVVAASFPEFMMLKQVMKVRLLLIFFAMLLVMFTGVGLIFNAIY